MRVATQREPHPNGFRKYGYELFSGADVMSAASDVIQGRVAIHSHERLAAVGGSPIDLSTREYEIMRRLAEHPGWVLSAEQLSSDDDEGDYSPESVSVLISRLRRKLAKAGATDVIDTVRGAGYRLSVAIEHDESPAETDDESRCALRDAFWHLQEAVLEAEHAGSCRQRREAIGALEEARRTIYAALAE